MLISSMRKDTAANWTALNPVLLKAEGGYETDTGKYKIGDGVTAWNALAYYVSGAGPADTDLSAVSISEHINAALPHPIYDDGPSLVLLYENAKV